MRLLVLQTSLTPLVARAGSFVQVFPSPKMVTRAAPEVEPQKAFENVVGIFVGMAIKFVEQGFRVVVFF